MVIGSIKYFTIRSVVPFVYFNIIIRFKYNFQRFNNDRGLTMINVILAGLFIMLTTSFGSMLSIIFRRLPEWGLEFSMAFSGGVMLVASFTSLILPSIDIGSIYIAMVGIVLGFIFIFIVERLVPHEDKLLNQTQEIVDEKYKEKLRNILLIVAAIIIHNLPEGMAVGISIVNNAEKGWATAIAIGIQDIPEGLAVSLPLIMLTKRLWIPIFIGILSGFSEFVFAVLGGYAFFVFSKFLPIGLSFSGGAMVYVTIKEVFPEVYRDEKNENIITFGFLAGLLLMLFLDTTMS